MDESGERFERRKAGLGGNGFLCKARVLYLAAGSITSRQRGRTIWAATRGFDSRSGFCDPAAATGLQRKHECKQGDDSLPHVHKVTVSHCSLQHRDLSEVCD